MLVLMKLHNKSLFSSLSSATPTTEGGDTPAMTAEEVPEEGDHEDPYARGFRLELDRRSAEKRRAKEAALLENAARAAERQKRKDASDLIRLRADAKWEEEMRATRAARERRIKHQIRDAAPIVGAVAAVAALAAILSTFKKN